MLCADETGWRINGVTAWLWAFATAQDCYYLIDRHRGTAVLTRKVSQQNRSAAGAQTHALLLTLFRSAHLQQRNPLEQVLQLATAAISANSRAPAAGIPLQQAA